VIGLDIAQASELVGKIIPDATLIGLTPIDGGLSNTNIAVLLAGPPRRVILRLYQGDRQKARTEAAIARRVAGYVPVSRVLGSAERNAVTGHPYEVLEWIEGEPLELVAPTLDDSTLAPLAAAVGAVLARIHAFRFDRCGFFAENLRLPEAIDLGPNALGTYLRQQLVDGPGGERLGPELTRDALALAERDGHLLDTWRADPCLVHGDFNGSNILVRRRGDAWEIAAVLDWEFALSGIPAMDFGTVMRPPLGSREAFTENLARGYRKAGGKLPDDWPRIARIADLFAWADMLGRPEIAAPIVEDARAAVRAALDRSQAG
jgi:aminoglycoside phosphotransferase (APT) family kinase protein